MYNIIVCVIYNNNHIYNIYLFIYTEKFFFFKKILFNIKITILILYKIKFIYLFNKIYIYYTDIVNVNKINFFEFY